jgi:hypothetical protein
MKRLALVAAVLAVAACSSQSKPAADTSAPAMAPAAAPAATDTTKKDTSMAKMDTTKKDTAMKMAAPAPAKKP